MPGSLQSNQSCRGLPGHRQSASVAAEKLSSNLNNGDRFSDSQICSEQGRLLSVHMATARVALLAARGSTSGPLTREQGSAGPRAALPAEHGEGLPRHAASLLLSPRPAQIQGEGTLLPDKVLGGHVGRETLCGHLWETQPAPWGWRLSRHLRLSEHLSEPGRCFFPKYGFEAAPPCPGRSLRSRSGVFCRL